MFVAFAIVTVGLTCLVATPGAALTVPSTLLTGVGGALGLNAVNPVLSDHHGDLGPGAIGEANAVASTAGVVAPLGVGPAVALGLTWRGATLFTLPLLVVASVLLVRTPAVPAFAPRVAHGEEASGPPPRAFWFAWGLLIACVGTEFCCTFWAADQLRSHVGLGAGAASASVSALLLGMAAGRYSSVPLTARWSVDRLLIVAIAFALGGWAVMWTATTVVVALLGLVLLGLGLALQFPLSLVRTMAESGGRPDTANALASLGIGLASGIAPFALGALADQVGSHNGFLLVPALLASAGVLLVLARAARTRSPAHP
jgi:fucose permease